MNVGSGFRSGKDDLAVDENQKNHTRLDHAIDEAGKEFGFVGAELLMHLVEFFQANWKAEIDGGYQILDFEIDEFYLKQNN